MEQPAGGGPGIVLHGDEPREEEQEPLTIDLSNQVGGSVKDDIEGLKSDLTCKSESTAEPPGSGSPNAASNKTLNREFPVSNPEVDDTSSNAERPDEATSMIDCGGSTQPIKNPVRGAARESISPTSVAESKPLEGVKDNTNVSEKPPQQTLMELPKEALTVYVSEQTAVQPVSITSAALSKPKSMFASLFPAPIKQSNQNSVSTSSKTILDVPAPHTTTISSAPSMTNTPATLSEVGDLRGLPGEKIINRNPETSGSTIHPTVVKDEPRSDSMSMNTTPVTESGKEQSIDLTVKGVPMSTDDSATPIGSEKKPSPVKTEQVINVTDKSQHSLPVEVLLKDGESKDQAMMVTETEPKQIPIAVKTMKKEQRKMSTTSPTLSADTKKIQRLKAVSVSPGGKGKKKRPPPKEDGQDGRNDFYCWLCHKEGEVLCCELCPRVFHAKCLHMTQEPEGDWFCPECERITEAECKETQSRAMSTLTIDQFSLLLKYVIQRMKLPMSEPFHEPVDTKMFPDYPDYVFHPMDLSTIEKNVKKRKYGCPEAFLTEFKWVIHNCIIYNSPQSKLTQTAKAMLKVAERELNEVEVCPECYLNSCRKRENWFCEPCKELHPLVWAKLQGFPHWPAKALRIEKGAVDVRFFGQHDRAWIPLSGCYLISKELPLPIKNKKKNKGPGLRGGLDGAMQEMQGYIENIKKITGEFEYAPPRTLLTHCDLYRKTGMLSTVKTSHTVKQETLRAKAEPVTEDKGLLEKADNSDSKGAKIESKDIGNNKEFLKSPVLPSMTPKKAKLVTTSGEHPARSFATKKKKASMEFLNKTIESCKASLGIEKLQDVRMNSGSEETTSSSDEEDNDAEDGKRDTMDGKVVKDTNDNAPSSGLSKPAHEDDDSDAELVIDLGDMEEPVDAGEVAKSSAKKSPDTDASPKPDEIAAKKRRTEEVPDKQSSGKPLKSILVSSSKPSDKDERKKMLARALSEKIATGKRKHDVDGSPSGSSPGVKVRRTHEQHDRRSGSPQEPSLKLAGKSGHVKDKKRSHHGGKHFEKDGAVKPKTGVLKSTMDSSILKKEGHIPSDKRPLDPNKHKYKDPKDGSLKLSGKKQSDKTGKLDKIPTGADARKLFNGGRIPRKNPVSNASDEESLDKEQEERESIHMETNQTSDIVTRRRSSERGHQILQTSGSGGRLNGVNKRLSSDAQSKASNENVTFASLKKYSDKVMDTVQKVFYEMYTDMMVPLHSNTGSDNVTDAATTTAMHQVAQMRLELERLKWMHGQEIAELKHNHDLTIAEMRQSLENEKKQLLLDARSQAEAERSRAVEEAKRKQWCAFCNKEAIFYCCWNTSYCDYPCQQKHWPQHMNSCTQARESATPGGGNKPVAPSKTSAPVIHGPSASTQSPAKTTFTITSSPGSISKLTGNGKSTIILPSTLQLAKQTPAALGKGAVKGTPSVLADKSAKIPVPNISDHPEKAGASTQQKSGLAISAIGARLLAAKQRSAPHKDSTSEATLSYPILTKAEASAAVQDTSSIDHVKTTLDSPMSPDARPPSPVTVVSPLVLTCKTSSADSSVSKPVKTTSLPKPIIPESPSSTGLSKVKITVSVSSISLPAQSKLQLVTAKPKITESSAQVSTESTVTAKLPVAPPILGFSPSVVASLVTDMDAPLSSSLSSSPGDSSSFTESPVKIQDDASKVKLSAAGSAFTKVIPDVSKHPPTDGTSSRNEKQPKLSSSSVKISTTTASSVSSTVASFKPIDCKTVTTPSSSSYSEAEKSVPHVAPILADSYLSTLQQTLAQKATEKETSTMQPITSSEQEMQPPKSDDRHQSDKEKKGGTEQKAPT